MADSLEMADLAFGEPGRAGRLLRGAARLVGSRGRRRKGRRAVGRRGRRRGRRAPKFAPSRGRRGITLSNEFVKTFILVNMIKGMTGK